MLKFNVDRAVVSYFMHSENAKKNVLFIVIVDT